MKAEMTVGATLRRLLVNGPRLLVRKAVRFTKRLLKLPRWLLSDAPIRMTKNLEAMPEPQRPSGIVVREMDMGNPGEIRAWLNIVNDAYDDFDGDDEDFERVILSNRHKTFFATYFALLHDEPVGCISAGFYKDDPTKAGCARLGIMRRARGQGIGTFMLLYGFYQPKTRGAKTAETEILIKRGQSIRLHLSLGFVPLYKMPQTGTLDRVRQRTANLRLRYLYWRWRRRQGY